MKRRNPNIYTTLKKRRKAEGITQIALAKEIGCKQSAISMMEAGNLDALSEDKLQKVAQKLGVELEQEVIDSSNSSALVHKYCPNHDCPSNTPYVAAEELFFMPNFIVEATHKKSKCIFCGEILQHECSNQDCGATISYKSACCNDCGEKYVECHNDIPNKTLWADEQRSRIEQIRRLID